MINNGIRGQFAKWRGGTFRTKRLQFAVATSAVSKGTTLAIQLFAIPMAIRALGPEHFAAYAILASSLAFLSMSNIGLGPALTVGTAAASASGWKNRESELLSSAFFPVLGISIFLGCVLLVVIAVLPVDSLFGLHQSVSTGSFRAGMVVMLVLTLTQSLLSIPEAVQGGHQELHIRNTWTSIGNGLSLVAILIVARYFPTALGMIIAVRAPFVLSQLVNSSNFLRRNPYLFPRWNAVNSADAKSLMLSGAAVMLVTLGSYLNIQLPIVIASRELGPDSTAAIATTFSAFILLFGMISMFGFPLRPAIADSMARGENRWAQQAHGRFVKYSMAYACLIGLAMAFVGPIALRAWVGSAIRFDQALLVLMGVYFPLAVWENVHYVTLVGLGSIRIPGALYFARSLVAMAMMIPLVRIWGTSGVPAALIVSVLLVTAPSLHVLTRLRFHQEDINVTIEPEPSADR